MHRLDIILITGGAGFIGSNLCQYLVKKGSKVVCLDNFDSFYSTEIKRKNIASLESNPLFKLIEGDIRDKELLKRIFSKNQINRVIHLAAKAGVRCSMSNPTEYYDVNVNGSKALLETMNMYNVKKLIFASSSSVYGNLEGRFSEIADCEVQISPYAASKRSVELLNYEYHSNHEFSVINLRLFSVYGYNQRPDLALHKFIRKISTNKPIELYGDGNSSRDYTFISDVIKAFHASLDLFEIKNEKIYEIINIGNNNPISLNKLIDIISLITKNDTLEIIHQKPVLGEVNYTHADITKAQKLLNYNPEVPIEKGIHLFYEWFKKTQLSLFQQKQN